MICCAPPHAPFLALDTEKLFNSRLFILFADHISTAHSSRPLLILNDHLFSVGAEQMNMPSLCLGFASVFLESVTGKHVYCSIYKLVHSVTTNTSTYSRAFLWLLY